MAVKLYTLYSSSSSRKAKQYFKENNIEVDIQIMNTNPMTKQEFMEILSHTECGVEDIIAYNSRAYKELVASGVDIEEMSLGQAYELIIKNPKILKAPIAISNGILMVGFQEDIITTFLPKQRKKKELSKILNTLRQKDKIEDMHLHTTHL